MIKWYLRYRHDISIAIEAIMTNKLRSLLTALGIIFGVAAVISMLAIGSGAQAQIEEQIKLVGLNNIIIKPIVSEKSDSKETGSTGNNKGKSDFSPGLTIGDLRVILETVPSVVQSSPVISANLSVSRQARMLSAKVQGVSPQYFRMFNLNLDEGSFFSNQHNIKNEAVCVIGDNIRMVFFSDTDPIGQSIRCGNAWLKVVGVVEKRDYTTSANDEMGISSSDNSVFVPINTFVSRIGDKSAVPFEMMRGSSYGYNMSGANSSNQLEKIVIQVAETEKLGGTAALITRIVQRLHNNNTDFEVTVPELLLKQQQQTNRIFNIVLGAIAGISLLVGGIGIMNIMLASVLERVKEIGTRQAIGATQRDIVIQFLSEAVLISFIGGIIGIVVGIVLAKSITAMADIKTIVKPISVFLSFGISALVGVLFGFLPARKASRQNPVESLR